MGFDRNKTAGTQHDYVKRIEAEVRGIQEAQSNNGEWVQDSEVIMEQINRAEKIREQLIRRRSASPSL